jgi:hypothetical protein
MAAINSITKYDCGYLNNEQLGACPTGLYIRFSIVRYQANLGGSQIE